MAFIKLTFEYNWIKMILKFLILLHCSGSYSTQKGERNYANFQLSFVQSNFQFWLYTPSAVNSFRNLHNRTNFLIMYKFWYLNQKVAIKDNLDAKKNSTWKREKKSRHKIWIINAIKWQFFFINSLPIDLVYIDIIWR